LATRLGFAHGVAWISAFGLAHQLPSGSVRVPGQGPSGLEIFPQEAWQASEGIEFVLPWTMLGRVTLFHSWIDTDQSPAKARNFGAEVFLRRHFTERLGGFVAYTLSRTERTFRRETRASFFDRTHVVSAVAGYNLGRGFRIGSRAYYTSGRPYVIACPTADCGPGDPAAPRPHLVEGRLPGFFRLDLRFEKRWRLSSGAWISAAFEWFNALLAGEITDADWNATRGGVLYEERSPLTLPSIGVEVGY
jgi:hypothetical protein